MKTKDINECEEGSHRCEPSKADCVNTAGSYRCKPLTPCLTGFRRNLTTGRCEGEQLKNNLSPGVWQQSNN